MMLNNCLEGGLNYHFSEDVDLYDICLARLGGVAGTPGI